MDEYNLEGKLYRGLFKVIERNEKGYVFSVGEDKETKEYNCQFYQIYGQVEQINSGDKRLFVSVAVKNPDPSDISEFDPDLVLYHLYERLPNPIEVSVILGIDLKNFPLEEIIQREKISVA